MTDFDVDAEQVNAFHVGEEYVFSHYFERTDLFEDLREYYDADAYRFEVPADEFDAVQARLEDAFVDLTPVEDPEPYCVVKEKYTPHADILRDSVATWERRGHLFFLMPDDLAVLEAVENGADRLAETEFVLGL